jgi:hypothetical protein
MPPRPDVNFCTEKFRRFKPEVRGARYIETTIYIPSCKSRPAVLGVVVSQTHI